MAPPPPVCAFLCSFSQLLLFFLPSSSCLPTAHTSFPPVCFQCQWHYFVAHGSGWLVYVMGSYQARQKTRKKESMTERTGTRQEKLWRAESIEEFAVWIQTLSFTAIQELSSICARSTFCQRARAARAYKGGWERDRNINKGRSQPVYRETGLGREVSPYGERRGRTRKAKKPEVKEQRRQQTQVISTLWLCCIDIKNSYNQVNCHQEIFTLKDTFLAYSEMAFLQFACIDITSAETTTSWMHFGQGNHIFSIRNMDPFLERFVIDFLIHWSHMFSIK